MNLMNIDPYLQMVVMREIILAAVLFDRFKRGHWAQRPRIVRMYPMTFDKPTRSFRSKTCMSSFALRNRPALSAPCARREVAEAQCLTGARVRAIRCDSRWIACRRRALLKTSPRISRSSRTRRKGSTDREWLSLRTGRSGHQRHSIPPITIRGRCKRSVASSWCLPDAERRSRGRMDDGRPGIERDAAPASSRSATCNSPAALSRT